MAIASDDEVTEAIKSVNGGFGFSTDYTLTVKGTGKVYVGYTVGARPIAFDDESSMSSKVAYLKAHGIPLVEGQFASDDLRAGQALYIVSDSGDVEYRVIVKGAE